MKFISELRGMIEDMSSKGTQQSGADKSITITGERHTVIVYAAGPVTIYGGNPSAPSDAKADAKEAKGKGGG